MSLEKSIKFHARYYNTGKKMKKKLSSINLNLLNVLNELLIEKNTTTAAKKAEFISTINKLFPETTERYF